MLPPKLLSSAAAEVHLPRSQSRTTMSLLLLPVMLILGMVAPFATGGYYDYGGGAIQCPPGGGGGYGGYAGGGGYYGQGQTYGGYGGAGYGYGNRFWPGGGGGYLGGGGVGVGIGGGMYCGTPSIFHYYLCCDYNLNDCCFYLQDWVKLSLVVIVILMLLCCIGSCAFYAYSQMRRREADGA